MHKARAFFICAGLLCLAFAPRSVAASAQLDTVRCAWGQPDNFDTADGCEPTTVSTCLRDTVLDVTNDYSSCFDVSLVDRWFAQSFSTCEGQRQYARLTFRARSNSSLGSTDVLYLRINCITRWGLRMPTLRCSVTGSARCTWSSGAVETFILDLSSLPPSDTHPSYGLRYPSGVTNLIPYLEQGGVIDVVIGDDTSLDYIAFDTVTPVVPTTWGQMKLLYR
jgi:hypothetical protein